MCLQLWVTKEARRGHQSPTELELQMVVSHSMWVLGVRSSFHKQYVLLATELSLYVI